MRLVLPPTVYHGVRRFAFEKELSFPDAVRSLVVAGLKRHRIATE